MLGTRWSRRLPRRMDRRGVALPMALFGLVAISILVTAALLTSTTDSAIAGAQRDAALEMYQAEGAVQAYVARMGASIDTGRVSFVAPGTEIPYAINVSRMSLSRAPGTDNGLATYALRGERASGGRSLVAMLRVPVRYLNVRVNAGASFGTDATISGSIDIKASSNLCSMAGADDAVTHAQGTRLEIRGQAATNIGSDTSTFNGSAAAMRDTIMNGIRLQDLARSANIRFRQASSNSDSVFNGRPQFNHTNQRYRWGCPREMTTECGGAGNANNYFPMVVIDARRADGGLGHVTIEGNHGQGMLIVLGGNLTIRGNFVFKGIIMVEGATDIHGGGSGGAKIEGALVGLGTVNICNVSSADCTSQAVNEDSDLASGAVIQFNRCAITEVQNFLNTRPVQQALREPTFAWFEVVR